MITKSLSGSAMELYGFAGLEGIPHETCRTYRAKNGFEAGPDVDCPAVSTCAMCTGPLCQYVPRYRSFYANGFGAIYNNIAAVKMELWARGPVVCAVDASRKMDDYQGGYIFEQDKVPQLNHDVSVVGWGLDKTRKQFKHEDVEYWLIRNSWGEGRSLGWEQKNWLFTVVLCYPLGSGREGRRSRFVFWFRKIHPPPYSTKILSNRYVLGRIRAYSLANAQEQPRHQPSVVRGMAHIWLCEADQ